MCDESTCTLQAVQVCLASELAPPAAAPLRPLTRTPYVMKTSQFLFSVILLSFSGSAISDSSLLGRWQSNSELSVKSIESVRELSPESREAYGRVFGQFKLSFAEDSVSIDAGVSGAEEFSISYRVLGSGPDHITVEFGDPDDPFDTAKYLYEDPCIKRKIEVGESLKGAFEYFCRVE